MESADHNEAYKIYAVDVEVKRRLIVLARSQEEAGRCAEYYAEEDMQSPEVDSFATELTSVSDYDDVIPWSRSVGRNDPRRDWTARQWLQHLAAKPAGDPA